MPDSYFAAFLVGLLGGVHCVGMCGGIVSTISFNLKSSTLGKSSINLPLHLAYNIGRISSYLVAGAIMGGLGYMLSGLMPVQLAQKALLALAGVFMVLLGLYLAGWWQVLLKVEQLGGVVWKHIEPMGRSFLPITGLKQSFVIGLLWGWIPCGLVYSVLIWSVSSGGMIEGSLLMLAFGLGTLPNLLAMGLAAERLKKFVRQPVVRQVAGILVVLLGCYNLWLALSY